MMTSGMLTAHTRWAHRPVSVGFSAPPRSKHRQHSFGKRGGKEVAQPWSYLPRLLQTDTGMYVLTCTEHWRSLHWLHSAHISCIASYWLNHPVMKLHSKLHGGQKNMCHSRLFHLMHTLKEPYMYKHSTYICVHICYRTDRWATVLPLHRTPQRACPSHYHPH